MPELNDREPPGPDAPLQVQLFRLLCAATGILCLGVVLPVNLLQDLPVAVNLAILVLGLFALGCFWASRKGRHHTVVFFVGVVAILNPLWFLNGGSQGCISYYFLPAALYPVALFRSRRRWILTVLLGLNFCGLLVLEHFAPSLTIPFKTPVDRLFDLLSGAACSFLLAAVVAWLIVKSFDREAERLTTSLQDLAASERDLRESRQRCTEVLSVAAEGIAVQRPDATVVDCNPAARRILNLSRDQVVGRRPVEFIPHAVHPDGRPFLSEEYPIAVTVRTRRPQQGIEMVVSTDTAQRPATWLLINTAPILDDAGAVRLVVTSFSDITDRKRVEADRLKLGKLESTGILAGGIAHDFNNLLTGMLLNIDLAHSSLDSPELARQNLEAARQAAAEATALTKQLITFADGGAPVRELANVEKIVRTSVRLGLSESSITDQTVVAPGIWSAKVDAGQIGQVVRNLLLNARDAMTGGGKVTVLLENVERQGTETPALPRGDYLRLSVADEGAGIAPEILPKIFDPYFSTKTRGDEKGMGLGLTICHSVVRNHGGAITVDSVPGKGTTVRVMLPALRERVPASAPPFAPGVARNARILVMDDDEIVRNIVALVAQRLGCVVAVAVEGQDAVEQYRQAHAAGTPFDLAILDLAVRNGMGGAQALRMLRTIEPTVKAIVMSGYANDTTLQQYATHGFNGALPKPFDTAALQAAISRALDK